MLGTRVGGAQRLDLPRRVGYSGVWPFLRARQRPFLVVLSDWFMHRLVAPTTCSLLLVLYYLYMYPF